MRTPSACHARLLLCLAALTTLAPLRHATALPSDAAPAEAARDGAADTTPTTDVAPPALPETPTEADDEPPTALTDARDDAFRGGSTGRIDLRALIQVRYAWTNVVDGDLVQPGDDGGSFGKLDPATAAQWALQQRATAQDDDGWRVERAFVRLLAKAGKRVTGRFVLDLAELHADNAHKAMKLAAIEVRSGKRFDVTLGYIKRRSSLLELFPTAEFEFAWPGPTDGFLRDMGWSGRDTGVLVRFLPLPKRHWLTVHAMASGGGVEDGLAAEPGKLLALRLEGEPWQGHLRLGGSVSLRRETVQAYNPKKGQTPFDVIDSGWMAGADATLALGGVELRYEALTGTRTDLALRKAYKQGRAFMAAWGVASYRARLWGVGVMPAVRAELLDVDRADTDHGQRLLGSAALNVDLGKGARLLLDFSHYATQAGSLALDDVPHASDGTRVPDVDWMRWTVQVQGEF
ncbi:MAG: hypothetical protein EXR79_16085 [Myxococcales bacterium]|nr:hypothetical protein [Myxococcales bacterium]